MKRTTTTDSTQMRSDPDMKHTLIRTGALAAAILIGTTAALLSIVPASRAFAESTGTGGHESFFASMHGGGHSHAGMHAHFDKVLTEAGASDSQKQQIRAIMKDAMIAEHADMETFHDGVKQLKTLLTADAIDDAGIASVRTEQDRLLLATSHRLSDTMVAVAKVLTPAQRAKLGAEIDRMMASHDMDHHGS